MTKTYPIKYIHPTLDRKCIIESEGNCNYVTMGDNILMKGEIKPFYFNESYLKSLGFIEAPTDTEEKGDKIENIFNDNCDWYSCGSDRTKLDNELRKLLSSLPIQKKRTREDVQKWIDGYPGKSRFSYHNICDFLDHIGLLSE